MVGHANVTVEMTDTYGDGWNYASYAILSSGSQSNETRHVVDNAFDGLCYGQYDTRSHCLSDGSYTFEVSRGYYPSEMEWAVCGVRGGAPSTLTLSVTKGRCTAGCDSSTVTVPIKLMTTDSDWGWDGAYYALYSKQTGKQLYGGTYPPPPIDFSQSTELNHLLCLGRSQCFVLLLEQVGEFPSKVSYSICGHTVRGRYAEVVTLCINENGTCSVSSLPTVTLPQASLVFTSVHAMSLSPLVAVNRC